MSRQIKVTEDKYNAVKILLKSGETQKNVGKYMDLAENTVGLIKRSENFEDYRNRMLATSVKYRGKDNQQEQTVPEPEKKEQPAQVVALHDGGNADSERNAETDFQQTGVYRGRTDEVR